VQRLQSAAVRQGLLQQPVSGGCIDQGPVQLPQLTKHGRQALVINAGLLLVV
jgi:hypothetical protein